MISYSYTVTFHTHIAWTEHTSLTFSAEKWNEQNSMFTLFILCTQAHRKICRTHSFIACSFKCKTKEVFYDSIAENAKLIEYTEKNKRKKHAHGMEWNGIRQKNSLFEVFG